MEGDERRAAPVIEQARAERNRLRILEAALAAFVERGYDGTAIRDVATAAGVSVPLAQSRRPRGEHAKLMHRADARR